MAIAGKIKEVVVAHKDRLTRFRFELIQNLIKECSKEKIIVINKPTRIPGNGIGERHAPNNECIHCKMNDLRKYKS